MQASRGGGRNRTNPYAVGAVVTAFVVLVVIAIVTGTHRGNSSTLASSTPSPSISLVSPKSGPPVPVHTFHPTAPSGAYLLPGYERGIRKFASGDVIGFGKDARTLALRGQDLTLIGRDVRTGAVAWRAPYGLTCGPTPPVASGRALCADLAPRASQNWLQWLDLGTGRLTRFALLPDDAQFVQTVSLTGETIVVTETSHEYHLLRLDARGHATWDTTVPGQFRTEAALVVVCRDDRRLTAVEKSSGWLTLKEFVFRSPTLASDGFINALEDGQLVALDYNGKVRGRLGHRWVVTPGPTFDGVLYPLSDYLAVGSRDAVCAVDAHGVVRAVQDQSQTRLVLLPSGDGFDVPANRATMIFGTSADGRVVLARTQGPTLFDTVAGRVIAALPGTDAGTNVWVTQGVIAVQGGSGPATVYLPAG